MRIKLHGTRLKLCEKKHIYRKIVFTIAIYDVIINYKII
jgi:hypothetical protein